MRRMSDHTARHLQHLLQWESVRRAIPGFFILLLVSGLVTGAWLGRRWHDREIASLPLITCPATVVSDTFYVGAHGKLMAPAREHLEINASHLVTLEIQGHRYTCWNEEPVPIGKSVQASCRVTTDNSLLVVAIVR